MEAPEVPVGALLDFGTEPAAPSPLEALPPKLQDGDSSQGDGASESETTESADSENDMGELPSHPSWDQYRRSSSNESFSSNQSAELAEDEETQELREFMRGYVDKIFSGGCHQMDDFGPAKNLMTMCFTYYHIGKPQLLPPESKEKPAGSIDSYLKSANSWLAEKKDIAERLLKNTSAKTENVKGFFGGLETKLKGPLVRKPEEEESKPKEKPQKTVTVCSPEEERKGEKIYLYTHLKQQPIWHTLRFWNAAFFDAVHCERRKRSPTTREKWCHMTQEERNDSLRFNENITFGQLGTFTHNMLAFGLNQKLCSDFLKKQAVIGNLDEEQYKLLSDHIEQMTAE
ncbi:uncharacterized protein KIAA0513 homolog isoform X2 [Prionailurus viverrinus]|uniref:uncharacterized protein KIAA0513 homolog isoform X2 n=1 Tax=Prionailurus viverrinus TaxID=61388 RepID=UPI001FF6C54D|nr:uncharacterized protein KIAA0513 homolog isoform X2 [Prionailurus viverrinus]